MSNWIDISTLNLALVLAAMSASVLWGVQRARRGHLPRIRRIAGVEAMEEAVGRATELGRPVFYVAGTQDLDDVQNIYHNAEL